MNAIFQQQKLPRRFRGRSTCGPIRSPPRKSKLFKDIRGYRKSRFLSRIDITRTTVKRQRIFVGMAATTSADAAKILPRYRSDFSPRESVSFMRSLQRGRYRKHFEIRRLWDRDTERAAALRVLCVTEDCNDHGSASARFRKRRL